MPPVQDRPSRFGDLDDARRHHDPELVEKICRSVFETDTAADRLVEAFAELPGGAGWRMLDTALRDGMDAVPDAPPALAEFLEDALHPPDWVDFELVDRGAVAWWRAGGQLQLLALTAGSLAYGYSTSFARPLLLTGRLEQMAGRRLGETSRWVLQATRPGALHPGADGLKQTIRIRLVHALVRRHLRGSDAWDTANWGEPISVGDTLATGIIGFFTYPVAGLRDLGIDYTDDELEAMTHQWAWISHLMGVPHEYLPTTYAEAVEIADAAAAVEDVRIEGADRLVHALFFHALVPPRFAPGPLRRPVTSLVGHTFAAVARHWMGPERADLLRIADTRARAVVPLLRALVRLRVGARRAGLLPSDARMVRLELQTADRIMDLAGAAPPMTPGRTAEEPVAA
ncbi:MAG: DUF2236 domain-containing protein [Solirubrobacteraceae bacterium]|nr:DUF2236 domain-containing protein [Solirubrobacteraceae bacterium]